jgi:uncharacterized protein
MNEDTQSLDWEPPRDTVWNWQDLVLILIGVAAIFLLGFTVFGLTIRLATADIQDVFQPSILLSLSLAFLESIALVGSVYLLGLRRRGLSWQDIGLRHLSPNWLMGVIAISIIVIPLSGLISALIMLILNRPLENPQLEFLIPEGFTWTGAVGMLVLGGIAVPFAEEVFFRGVLYKWIRQHWGLWPGVLISSLIFGLVHIDIAVAGAAFVLGIILALIYEYSRSLWSAVLVHAINNSVKIALLYAFLALGLNIEI